MKPLSRKSWLYKVNYKLGTQDFRSQVRRSKLSLCTLMSSSVLCLIVIIATVIAVSVLGLVFITFVLAVMSPVLLLTGMWFEGIDIFYKMLYFYMAAFSLAGLMTYFDGGINFAPDYMKFKSKPDTTKHSIKDSYIVQYVKALKDKVCPIIDITED